MAKLTHRTLQASKENTWLSDGGPRGAGTLVARKLAGGSVLFYFRYTLPSGARDPLAMGEWAGTGGPLSLEDAREQANRLSARYRAGARDLRAVLDAEAREARREREATERAEEQASARREATLGALMTAYVGELVRSEKSSAQEVAGSIKRHVTDKWPKLAQKPADDITLDDLLTVVAAVADQGKLREAAKVRSYLQAAYNAGIRARQAATASPELRTLRITTNPARDLATIDGATSTKERALSVEELRAYWRRIESLEDPKGAALRFHLLTGGQRRKQLSRLTYSDYSADEQTVTIRDKKGRRKVARAHVVPLIPAAVEALHAMAPERIGDYLFTISGGTHGVSSQALDKRKDEIVEAMLEARELSGGTFTLGDIRRTVETRAAALAVSQEVRGQLQSHGLGGVQARHYDRHKYLDEKRAALEALYRLLTGTDAKVIPLRSQG